jgi:Ni/Fe-hydrogenase subunit HybB-like protein
VQIPVEGFMYPNEVELQWSVLIVLYPFITGLVAGAFILASLERVFRVQAVKPAYRLALLTALAFLLVAPLPLQLHLGHPERSFEMYFTPHRSSAMAMFGFVYLWYLMAVLLMEVWLDYRRDIVLKSQCAQGLTSFVYRLLTLGSDNISERSLRIDERLGYFITLVGIPSAFLLHGYVGFIFGSVKANPWWSSPLMPIVFIFSAMVSGIAAVMLLYMISTRLRRRAIDIRCLDKIAQHLLYTFVIDFSLEMLDQAEQIIEIPWFRPSAKISIRQALTQAAMHSHYHRGQNATRLRELGGVPPMTDFIAWLHKGQPPAQWD